MKVGYARVSTTDQNHELQLEPLKAEGCERVFQDTASGGQRNRPELDKMLDQLRQGDMVVVWKLDRLSRSLGDLLNIVDKIGKAGASFKSLTEELNTDSPAGRAMFQMVGVFSEFERGMIRERTRAGLKAAKAEGRCGRRFKNGQRFKLSDCEQAKILRDVSSGHESVAACARLFNVHPATIWRLVKRSENAN